MCLSVCMYANYQTNGTNGIPPRKRSKPKQKKNKSRYVLNQSNQTNQFKSYLYITVSLCLFLTLSFFFVTKKDSHIDSK